MIVSADFLEVFSEVAQVISLKRKDFLVKEGQIASYLGIVLQGTLFSYLETKEGDRQINDLYGPRSVVSSYRSFLTQTPSAGIVQAYTNCQIAVVSFPVYEQLMEEHPQWLKAFKWIGDQLYIEKCRKQTSLTTMSVRERHLQLLLDFPDIEQLFPQHLIASYLNVRPETLSRMKSLDLSQEKK